jgi:hypothetical protein
VCDLCRSADDAFVACSLACLERHLDELHPEASHTTSGERARAFQREMNSRSADDWARYSGHRRHLTDLVTAATAGSDVCVFGAGNASDIDLERLALTFETVHLVDIDGEALRRASGRLTPSARDKLFLHELDLTGFIDRIDEWSAALPRDLVALTVEASRELVSRLGRSFDVTVSNCVLSQLSVPFKRMWGRTVSEWSSLEAGLTVVHVMTLAGALRPGGRGVLVFDTLSSAQCPALAQLAGVARDQLEDALAEVEATYDVEWSFHPADILEAVETAPPLVALIDSPCLTQPWLWDLGDAIQVVYALVFNRRSNAA